MHTSGIRHLVFFLLALLACGTAYARSSGPCDIFSSSTPCVAAFSTTRALYASYTGPLYQVTRASDNTTLNIGILSDGYANAAAQDAFCAGTKCSVGKLYDQTSHHNDLTVAPPGGAATGPGANGYDLHAIANAFPVTAGGHKVYGIYINPGMGYRNDATNGIATNGSPEGMYMVTSTTHINRGCCFDFGNAETNNLDNGAGHMDAIIVRCPAQPCSPVTGVDMENGILGNLAVPANTPFLTVMAANDGQKTYTLWQGNAKSGGLTSSGTLTLPSGYSPMHQEGAIILGIGGDNSDRSVGTFFEGVMTAGAPSSTTMSSVQSNIVSIAYEGMLPYHDAFASGSAPNWHPYGGSWSVSGEAYTNTATDRGDKSLTGSAAWDNYTLQGDVQVTSGGGDAGLILRVTNPATGEYAFDGYYAGVTSGGHLNFMRMANNWTLLQQASLPGGFTNNSWYHIAVQAVGCTFTVSAQKVGSTTVTGFTYTDTGCTFTAGQIGVRSTGVAAQWRDVNAAVGGSSTLPYYAPFASSATGWTSYGGSWTTASESYINSSSDASDMSISSTSCTACTVNADVMLTSSSGTAGLLLAASNPGVGTDNVSAYYLSVDSLAQIDLANEHNSLTQYDTAGAYLNAFPANTWYHLTASINGCYVRLVAQKSTSEYPDNDFTVESCAFTSGLVGVQSTRSSAKWRYVSVAPN